MGKAVSVSQSLTEKFTLVGIEGKVCRAHEECSEHGICSYSKTLGYYHCTCKEPYVGNGVECTIQEDGAQERGK